MKSKLNLLTLICLTIFSSILSSGLTFYYLKNNQQMNSSTTVNKQISLQETSAIIDLNKKVSQSVVSLVSEVTQQSLFGSSSGTSAGTGFIITSSGLVLTNKHVVDGATNLKAILSDGTEVGAKVVDEDSLNDLAFVQLDKKNLTAIELGDSDNIQIGQKVVAIGNALGEFNNTVTSGIVSGIGRPIAAQTTNGYETLSNLIQTDAAINPGNSGGPLMNLEGQVIGINVAKAEAQSIGFAIPINEAKVVIDSVIKNGKIVRPYLGIRYLANNKDYKAQYDFPTADGVIIVGSLGQKGVLSDSPAEKAGLQEQDILVKIADKDINQKQSLASILATLKVGDKVTIEFYRGKELKKAELTLGEQKQ